MCVAGPVPSLRGGDGEPSVGDVLFCFCCTPCFNCSRMAGCSARNAVCCCLEPYTGVELLFGFNIGEKLFGKRI